MAPSTPDRPIARPPSALRAATRSLSWRPSVLPPIFTTRMRDSLMSGRVGAVQADVLLGDVAAPGHGCALAQTQLDADVHLRRRQAGASLRLIEWQRRPLPD